VPIGISRMAAISAGVFPSISNMTKTPLARLRRFFRARPFARELGELGIGSRELMLSKDVAPVVRHDAPADREQPAPEGALTRVGVDLSVHDDEDLLEEVLEIAVSHPETRERAHDEGGVRLVEASDVERPCRHPA